MGTMKSNEEAGSTGERPGTGYVDNRAAGVVLAAISNLFLMALVEGGDVGSAEIMTDSLGTGECSEAWP